MNVTLASLGAQAASLVPRLAPTIKAEAYCEGDYCCSPLYATTCWQCCTYSRCWETRCEG